jgi:hypothetical protein
MPLTPYPTEFPPETFAIVADALRGKVPNKAAAVHTSWCVVGFGLGQALPDGPQVVGETPMDSEAAASALEGLAAGNAQAFPWRMLLPVVLELIQKLINK